VVVKFAIIFKFTFGNRITAVRLKVE
jgi:hypothetical protein